MYVLLASSCLSWPQVYGAKPCDATVEYEHRNMVDYTLKVRHMQGKVIDPFSVEIPRACIAVFNSDHSKLLRTVESDEQGNFIVDNVPPGEYWLVVKDQQRAFCPALAKVEVGRLRGKSAIVVHMQLSGIDRCSFCEGK